MKQTLLKFLAIFLLTNAAYAEEKSEFPNISGNVLTQFKADRVLSTSKSGVSPNNAYVYVEPNLALNLNQNWSIKTDWRLQPNSVLTTRDKSDPERYRTFLQSGRGIGSHDTGLLVEELKVNFKNEDLEVFAGKFDPKFGTAHNKTKRIGIFTSDFTEDYNLREKIGAGITALLENSKITFNTFFNDTTGLSSSAINNRGRAQRNDGLAGNTGTLSSYSIAMSGDNFLGYEDWFYNAGYRSLSVDKMNGRSAEKGYVFGSEYSYKVGVQTYLVPFVELVKIDNFTGLQDRNALYLTAALMAKYSSWNASVSYLNRHMKQQNQGLGNINDKMLQLSIGYKFTNNVTLDVTRSNIKENGYTASLIGAMLSYVYKF